MCYTCSVALLNRRVIVMACKCTGCMGMLAQRTGRTTKNICFLLASAVSVNTASILRIIIEEPVGLLISLVSDR